MAIERSDVLRAVEKYLPRTVNFAQSSDLGEKDSFGATTISDPPIPTPPIVDPVDTSLSHK